MAMDNLKDEKIERLLSLSLYKQGDRYITNAAWFTQEKKPLYNDASHNNLTNAIYHLGSILDSFKD